MLYGHDMINLGGSSVTYILFFCCKGPGHLTEVLMCLIERGLVARWRMIGVLLRLPYSDLEIIENNKIGEENRLIAMLNQWLVSGRATKQALVDVLQRL